MGLQGIRAPSPARGSPKKDINGQTRAAGGRLALARCFQCSVPLEWVPGRHAHACPMCGRSVPEEDRLRGVTRAGYGIAADEMAEEIRNRPGRPRADAAILDGYIRRDLSHQGSRATGMAAAQMLTGPSLKRTMGAYVVPQAPVGPDGAVEPRAELVGTLTRFIAYLKRNSILEDIEAPLGHHLLHKYAYIAMGLGMRLGYDFDFLENGAFSADLEVDLFDLDVASGGTEPFGGDACRSGTFLDLVRGRDAEWLQVATFAVRDRDREDALEKFLARRGGIIKYEKGMAISAFEAVTGCVEGMAGGAS